MFMCGTAAAGCGALACCSVARFRECGAAAVWLSIGVEGLIFLQPIQKVVEVAHKFLVIGTTPPDLSKNP
jgi:hypothetical protein